MQTIEWSDLIEVSTLIVTFIATTVSIAYILRQNGFTKILVGSAKRTNEQLESSNHNLRETIELNKAELSLASQQILTFAQPNIVLAFENPESEGGRKIFLVVRNVGVGAAYKVKIRFEPNLANCSSHFKLGHLHQLIDSIAILPPGERIGHVFDHVLDIRQAEFGPPETYTATIEYSDENGSEYSFTQILSARPFIKKQSNWFFIERF